MNTLSDIFDMALQALGTPVTTGCNGHVLFIGCIAQSVIGAIYFRRWSWGALLASAVLGILGNLLRIALLLPLAGIPHFVLIHDLTGWAISGLVFLVVVECYEPTRETAVWIGRGLCALLFVWAVLFAVHHAFPGPTGRVTDSETFYPKNPGIFLEGKK